MFARLLLAALLAATMASAQGKKGGGNNTNSMGDFRPAPRQTKFELFADKLKLSKEQKDEALTILNAAMEESVPMRQELEKSRVAIASALIDGKSADEVKKTMDDYTSAAAQMTGVEAKAFSKLYASLKPNQQPKAGQSFDLLAQVLDGPASGGSGGRGGRGRGRQ